ncbi:MAG: hypothetical protein WCO30_01735 [bacterium]
MTINKLRSLIKKLDEKNNKITYLFSKSFLVGESEEYYKKISEYQKGHWLGWIQDYEQGRENDPGGYNRKKDYSVNSEDVYKRLLSPYMILWLSEATGVPKKIVIKAKDEGLNGNRHVASVCSRIRKVIPWETVEFYLLQKETKNV